MNTKELLQRQIDVLNEVKVLRVENPNRSNYVCDNIQSGVAHWDTARGLGLYGKPEARAICADIAEYIGGAFSVDQWLGMDDQHELVEDARIKMIDTLIQRYQAQIDSGTL